MTPYISVAESIGSRHYRQRALAPSMEPPAEHHVTFL